MAHREDMKKIKAGEELEIAELLNSIGNLFQADGMTSRDGGQAGKGELLSGEFTEDALLQKGFLEEQIQEIMLGLQQKLPVSAYAKNNYSWKQMQQIRLGMLENLDTTIYQDPLFSADQMYEIREGLLNRLDVSSYAKLLYTATDMANKRKQLMAELYKMNPLSFGKEVVDEESGLYIRVSDDGMEAYIIVPEDKKKISPYTIKKILSNYDVVYGIRMEQLERDIKDSMPGEEVLAARGQPAQNGRNGRYEYIFNKLLPESPKINENGSVDYTEVMVAEKVNRGDILARYHKPTVGKKGTMVTGVVIDGKEGKELPRLNGTGFTFDAVKNLYKATQDGYVSFDDIQYSLNVRNIFFVDGDVNRYERLSYDGTIHVKGSVCNMAVVNASGDVIVDGYVGGAEITAGGNVILKNGINADGKGFIQAGGKVMGNFFEFANITAKGRIEGNYFLNCTVRTENILLARGKTAKIMGGDIKAASSVESAVIGNFGGPKTIIDVGDLFWIDKKMNPYLVELRKVRDELSQLEAGKIKLEGLLGEEGVKENKLYKTTCHALVVKEEQQASLEREINYYNHVRSTAQNCCIKATGGIQTGVIVIVNGTRTQVESPVKKITAHKQIK